MSTLSLPSINSNSKATFCQLLTDLASEKRQMSRPPPSYREPLGRLVQDLRLVGHAQEASKA